MGSDPLEFQFVRVPGACHAFGVDRQGTHPNRLDLRRQGSVLYYLLQRMEPRSCCLLVDDLFMQQCLLDTAVLFYYNRMIK